MSQPPQPRQIVSAAADVPQAEAYKALHKITDTGLKNLTLRDFPSWIRVHLFSVKGFREVRWALRQRKENWVVKELYGKPAKFIWFFLMYSVWSHVPWASYGFHYYYEWRDYAYVPPIEFDEFGNQKHMITPQTKIFDTPVRERFPDWPENYPRMQKPEHH
eukprot:TRINITY_DN10_c0_g1_i1.p1 TRINITY_DN10_c0_g1~~TRINITY_DN10_c0_g1_i1.p1  ORF type:complete len:174 (-),score=34.09 TRINITY_DN10_c0_g1_i1:45-527(-)